MSVLSWRTSTFLALCSGRLSPRYLKPNFISVGTHSHGYHRTNIVIDRDDQIMGAGGAHSGYPAGITVANWRNLHDPS